jgi:hypothetical protein
VIQRLRRKGGSTASLRRSGKSDHLDKSQSGVTRPSAGSMRAKRLNSPCSTLRPLRLGRVGGALGDVWATFIAGTSWEVAVLHHQPCGDLEVLAAAAQSPCGCVHVPPSEHLSPCVDASLAETGRR